MRYLRSFTLAGLLAGAAAIVVPDPIGTSDLGSSGRCQCFVVSGPDPGYFQNYRFYDFRSIIPGDGWKDSPKSSQSTRDFSPEEPQFAPIESPEPVPLTGGDWDSQAWRREGSTLFPVPIQNSPRNVFISRDEAAGTEGATYLTMRTMRHQDFSSTAEIVTKTKNFLHCSVRIRLRLLSGNGRPHPTSADSVVYENDASSNTPLESEDGSSGEDFPAMQRRQPATPPPPGAVAGIFTYHSFTSETDIEILTSDPPNQVRYVNQPSYDPIANVAIPGAATTVPNLPIPWTEWSTHRLDWLPGMSRWYVNNMEQATKTYGVPHDPSVLVINLWSDGGVWSGNLTMGDAVHLGIEWIEIAYNTSNSAHGPVDRNGRGEADKGYYYNTVPTTQKGHGSDEKMTNANVCMVGCRIDDNDVNNLGIPQLAWDNGPSPKNTSDAKQVSFDPIVIPNPLITNPQNPEDEMQNDAGESSVFQGSFVVVFAVVGVIATNFLLP